MGVLGKHNKTVLYLDDEQANLDGFLYIFRKDFQVFTATNTRDAFEIINKNKIKVVLSDNRMPDMFGTEFFEILSVSHPDIIRIIVTAYADTDAVMQAINKGRVYRFITKPWDKKELQMSIDNALEAFNLKQENNELIVSLTEKNLELEDLMFQLQIEVAERTKAEEELAQHKTNLEQLVKDRTNEIERINKDLEKANKELLNANIIQNRVNAELEDANKQLNKEIEIRTYVQEMLAESEDRFRGLNEQSSEGILLIDITGKIIECNKALENIMEVEKSEVINTMLWDFDYRFTIPEQQNKIKKDKIKNAVKNYLAGIDTNKSFPLEGYRFVGDGKLKYISTILFPIITPKAKYLGRIVRDFTEKTKKDEELRLYKENLEKIVMERTAQLNLSETRLRTLSNNLPGGAIYRGYTDEDGVDHLVFASARISQISGFTYDSLIDNIDIFFSKIHPQDMPLLIEARKKSQSDLSLLDLELRYIRSSRVELWVQLRTMYKREDDGLLWWDGYVIDITKRKLAEQAARESSVIIENIQAGIASITGEKLFETILLKLSETLKPELTYIGEISGKNKDKIRTITVCSKGKISENMEYPIIGTPCNDVLYNNLITIPFGLKNRYPDNETYCILNVESFVGVPLFDSHGMKIGIMVAAFTHPLDDTLFAEQILKIFSSRVGAEMERISAEAGLKEREERFRTLFELSPNYKLITSIDGKILEANPAFVKMSGYRKNQIIGSTLMDLNVWSETENNLVLKYLKSQGRFRNIEVMFKDRAKNIHYALMSVEPVVLNGVTSLLTTATDISERKRSEQIIKESEQKLLNIFNNSSDGIVITDFSLNIIAINETLIKMLGYENTDLTKLNPFELILPEYYETIKSGIQQLMQGEKGPSLDVEVRHKNGTIMAIEVNSKLIMQDGKPVLLNILRDTGERKSMEKKLFETIIYTEEKERERFAGDLHDEVGPLLSSLKMYISLLSETEDKKKKEYIIPQIHTLIKESITTVREISNDLSPHVLNNYGCVAAINSFLTLKSDFLNITFSQNLENKRFETNTEIVLYRIIKELVNNTIKHAKASKIAIRLFEEDNQIKLQYTDNGVGFDINSTVGNTAGSIGLLNIMSRIKSVNGKYKINSAQGSGFDFELNIIIGKRI